MKKTIEEYYCDVCKKQTQDVLPKIKIQVIFTTEQTEGRSIKPYLSNQDLEICGLCQDHVLKGNYIFGHGAMGHNDYYFNSKD